MSAAADDPAKAAARVSAAATIGYVAFLLRAADPRLHQRAHRPAEHARHPGRARSWHPASRRACGASRSPARRVGAGHPARARLRTGAAAVGTPRVRARRLVRVRLVIARCSVDYAGRLTRPPAAGDPAARHKGDGSLLVHSDGGSYKPLNWMSPPCTPRRRTSPTPSSAPPASSSCGTSRTPRPATRCSCDPRGAARLLARARHRPRPREGRRRGRPAAPARRAGRAARRRLTLVRREFPTAIGPVDLLAQDAAGGTIAVEVKRRGDIDGVEQLTRYLELLGRDPHLAPVTGRLRRPGDQAAGAHARRRPRHPLRHARLRRHARARRRPPPGCSDASFDKTMSAFLRVAQVSCP